MKRFTLLVCAALAAGLVPTATADFTYGLCVEFSGADAPSGPMLPWTEATFAQLDDGDVLLTLSATHLIDEEFMVRGIST